MVGAFLEPSCGRRREPIHSILYSVAQPLERGSKNYYFIIQGGGGMINDEKIIEMFFERSEQGIRELDIKYGKICHNLSYNIVNSSQDAEECVNDAYLGAWNAIPPTRPNPLLSYIVKIVRNISLKIYWRKINY